MSHWHTSWFWLSTIGVIIHPCNTSVSGTMKFWSLFRNTEPPSKVHMDIQLSINWRCYWIEWCSDAQSSNERMISGCHHEPFKLGEIICMFTLSCVEPTLQLNLDLSFFFTLSVFKVRKKKRNCTPVYIPMSNASFRHLQTPEQCKSWSRVFPLRHSFRLTIGVFNH